MMGPTRRHLCRPILAIIALLLIQAGAARAESLKPVRAAMNLNLDGSNAAFVLARERGFFREAGLDVTIDPSRGSGDAIARTAGGGYDFAYADVSTLVDFWGKNPTTAPKVVLLIQDRSPQVVVSLRRAGIARPEDLIGKTVGATVTDGASLMFPAFARLAGLDLARIKRQIVDVRLRDALLLRGEVDAVLGFDLTVWFNLKAQGVRFEDVAMLYFADYGLDSYGNALLASRAIIAQAPETVAGFVQAAARGWQAAIADPAAAARALAARDPLVQVGLEAERLAWTAAHEVVTPRTRADGIGTVDPARLESNIRQVAEAFELARRPTVADILDDRFLPPIEARRLAAP